MTAAVCAPEDAPLRQRLRWSWRNATYRVTAVYTAALVTVNTVLIATGTGC